MKRQIIAVSSDIFSYHPNTKCMIADASDLRGVNLNQQIFDDAVDVGFAIRSERTKKVEVFSLIRINKDEEGEVVSWTYAPIDYNLSKIGLKVIILND